ERPPAHSPASPASHVAQDDLPGTPPADRHEIAYAAADHQPRRSGLMAQIAVGVENRTGEQAVAVLEGDYLTAVEVAGQDQVVAATARRLPDARVVCAEDPGIAP